MATIYDIHEDNYPIMYMLFIKRFTVKIPYTYTGMDRLDEITGKDGNKEILENHNRPTRVSLTVPELCEIFNAGGKISFVNPGDMFTIYDAIQAHITSWLNYCNGSLNNSIAPVKDLSLLSEFGKVIHANHETTVVNGYVGDALKEMDSDIPDGFVTDDSEHIPKVSIKPVEYKNEQGYDIDDLL